MFRSPRTIYRESKGSYVDGRWVAGERSIVTISASVQPVNTAESRMILMPDGRHTRDIIKMYTDTRLLSTEDGEGIQPDVLSYDGWGYEIINRANFQSNVINHYRYYLARSFKLTSDADWLSGETSRENE